MSQHQGRRHGSWIVSFRWHAWALPLGVLYTRGYWSVAIGPWTFEYFYYRETP